MMYKYILFTIILLSCNHSSEREQPMLGKEIKLNKLTTAEQQVIINKGTEAPFSGQYTNHFHDGIYVCKQCNAMLYRSQDKFKSHCGWPSFDDELPGAVKRLPDADGRRTEIICKNCNGHLGHIFTGEGFTTKNTRHCVNSISLKFIPNDELKVERAIFAGGCFWGVEHYLQQQPGVIDTTVGYTGGHKQNPTYKEVCNKNTGHVEALEVIFDPQKISYRSLSKLFFEIHDPTQVDRQGPDVGSQYRSQVFYCNEKQKQTIEQLIKILQDKGYNVVTKLSKATTFWAAEDYHQDYYRKKGTLPYCHRYQKRF